LAKSIICFALTISPGRVHCVLPSVKAGRSSRPGDGGSDEDLKLLLAPGSSLGGARPKASVIDRDSQLAIAKFPQHGDLIPTRKWEAVALTLAAEAGLTTPVWRMENIGKRPVLILRRFDASRDGACRFSRP
jgi:serine/threonine-protein kinase HipA